MKDNLLNYSLEELIELCEQKSVPKYRAEQIFHWLHKGMVASFDEMTNIPKSLRDTLSQQFDVSCVEKIEGKISGNEQATKVLFKLRDNQMIETVVMSYRHGRSICISTQAGCKMGCRFCASAKGGLVRNLSAAEMLDQLRMCSRDVNEDIEGKAISHIVLMGSGEPLDNYEQTLRFIKLAHHPKGMNISYRNMTISTCGIVPAIHKLALEEVPVTLAISLHAPYDQLRKELMPGAARYSISEILKAGLEYRRLSGRRVTIEYAMIDGINDSLECARELTELIKGTDYHVNLIPLNLVDDTPYRKSKAEAVSKFEELLKSRRVNVTIRRSLAPDIEGACGQLRNRARKN